MFFWAPTRHSLLTRFTYGAPSFATILLQRGWVVGDSSIIAIGILLYVIIMKEPAGVPQATFRCRTVVPKFTLFPQTKRTIQFRVHPPFVVLSGGPSTCHQILIPLSVSVSPWFTPVPSFHGSCINFLYNILSS